MDTLKFTCIWGKSTALSQAKATATLTGLRLEGCLFDGARLSPAQRSSARLVCDMFDDYCSLAFSQTQAPDCTVGWIPKVRYYYLGFVHPNSYQQPATALPQDDSLIMLPLYYTTERAKIVTCLEVPTGGNTDAWIESGASFILE